MGGELSWWEAIHCKDTTQKFPLAPGWRGKLPPGYRMSRRPSGSGGRRPVVPNGRDRREVSMARGYPSPSSKLALWRGWPKLTLRHWTDEIGTP